MKLRGDSDCLSRWVGDQFDPGLVWFQVLLSPALMPVCVL